MPVPDYQTFMLPLMEIAEDGQVHRIHDAIEFLAELYGLSDEDRRELLPSGKQTVLYNRVGWARTYLVKAGLLRNPGRAQFQITPRGLEIMRSNPTSINTAFLRQFPEFQEFQMTNNTPQTRQKPPASLVEDQTPEDALESGYRTLRRALASELLDRIKASSPAFFEQLVVDLLVTMGYGGSRADAGQAIGRGGDGGIDGIIKEDRLGLDVIYIQAKRWENTVGEPEIQKFVGSLAKKHTDKGVFITTSDFSQQAREYVQNIGKRISLIDGVQLAEYMIDFGVGVSEKAVYVIKRIDEDYFSGE
jgi:restriction system protein